MVEALPSKASKSKKINLLKLAQEQNAKVKGLLAPDDVIVISESPVARSTAMNLDIPNSVDSPMSVDRSIASSAQESEYGFDALHTDDQTDHEESQFYAPYWSLYTNRRSIVVDQTNINWKVVDTLFDVKPLTVNSQEIFTKSSPIQRRRSTAVWNTPPRYSMLPKY